MRRGFGQDGAHLLKVTDTCFSLADKESAIAFCHGLTENSRPTPASYFTDVRIATAMQEADAPIVDIPIPQALTLDIEEMEFIRFARNVHRLEAVVRPRVANDLSPAARLREALEDIPLDIDHLHDVLLDYLAAYPVRLENSLPGGLVARSLERWEARPVTIDPPRIERRPGL